MNFEMRPDGPFNLKASNEYFGGWLSASVHPSAITMAFPVEGWTHSAAVTLWQEQDTIKGQVYGTPDPEQAWQQALAVLSLDQDASEWPAVGKRDPVIGNLQAKYGGLRPVLFHSAYESAAAFIIGHRISIEQGRTIRQAMARAHGQSIEVEGVTVHAFPQPQTLLGLTEFKGLNEEKIKRLHGVAQAALKGQLDRAHLRSLPTEQALEELCTLRGVGDFFSQGILYRGAGLVDIVPDDDVTKQAVQRAYGLPELPAHAEVLARAEAWKPYRMWTSVLLHVWLRREAGGPLRMERLKRKK